MPFLKKRISTKGRSKYEEAELAVETPKPAIPELENERKERAAALEANAAQPREIEGNHRFELADSRSVDRSLD